MDVRLFSDVVQVFFYEPLRPIPAYPNSLYTRRNDASASSVGRAMGRHLCSGCSNRKFFHHTDSSLDLSELVFDHFINPAIAPYFPQPECAAQGSMCCHAPRQADPPRVELPNVWHPGVSLQSRPCHVDGLKQQFFRCPSITPMPSSQGSRLMLSPAMRQWSYIGSLRLDDDTSITLANRPIPFKSSILESEGAPKILDR
jgi:hypothetical protein